MHNRFWDPSNLLTASSQASTGFVRILSSIIIKYWNMNYKSLTVLKYNSKYVKLTKDDFLEVSDE